MVGKNWRGDFGDELLIFLLLGISDGLLNAFFNDGPRVWFGPGSAGKVRIAHAKRYQEQDGYENDALENGFVHGRSAIVWADFVWNIFV